jgi:hypothetical protein
MKASTKEFLLNENGVDGEVDGEDVAELKLGNAHLLVNADG